MHADFAIRAARAGKHVMVEKPLAVSEDEALAMIAAARAANVFLMTAYRLHNEPGTVAVLEHIRANAIGRPLFFQSVFSFQTAMGNHRLKASTWGGPLQDVGVYCINAARHIFAEEPIEAMAMSYRPEDDPRFGDIDASVAATLRFPLGRPRAIRRQLRGSGGRQLPGRGNVGRPRTRPWIQIRGCDTATAAPRRKDRRDPVSADRSFWRTGRVFLGLHQLGNAA